MAQTSSQDAAQPSRSLTLARAMLALLIVSLLALWLINLPEYFRRVTMLAVDTHSQAGEIVASNDLVQAEAAARGLSLPLYALYEVGFSALLLAAFWVVAALILWRAETGWFGWFTALILAALGAINTLVVFDVTQPLRPVLAAVDLLSWIAWPGLFVWLFLFPSGWTRPRWAWWSVVVMATIFLGLSIRDFLAAWGILSPDPANQQFTLGLPLVMITLALVVYAQIRRYRRGYSLTERQQVKWFVFGMALLLIELVLVLVAPPATVSLFVQDLYTAVLLVIPASIGVAILRYRLFDIDVVIRKTLVYTVLTVLLALVYFGVVIILQGLFSRLAGVEQSTLAVVISTMAIAALFTPLRRRIQDWIDRRFYRKKYNAQQVLAQFAQTARDETDLDALLAELVRVVDETLQPEHVSVWLKDPNLPMAKK